MKWIRSDENIRLAYRNIKRNTGSKTAFVQLSESSDKHTAKHLLKEDLAISHVCYPRALTGINGISQPIGSNLRDKRGNTYVEIRQVKYLNKMDELDKRFTKK